MKRYKVKCDECGRVETSDRADEWCVSWAGALCDACIADHQAEVEGLFSGREYDGASYGIRSVTIDWLSQGWRTGLIEIVLLRPLMLDGLAAALDYINGLVGDMATLRVAKVVVSTE